MISEITKGITPQQVEPYDRIAEYCQFTRDDEQQSEFNFRTKLKKIEVLTVQVDLAASIPALIDALDI